MPKIVKFTSVRTIFLGEEKYCPQFMKSQKTPLKPSDQRVS